MKYLLDTNVLIDMFRGDQKIRGKIVKAGFDECAVSAITYAEILTGCHLAGYEAHKHEEAFLKENFTIIPVEPSISKYAEIRADLLRNGTPVDNFDILIGATALVHKLTIVTHNKKHFEKIPGLQIRDWRED